MSIKKSIFKIPLDIISSILKSSKNAVYYLVNESLKEEIKDASKRAFAYEHIETSCTLLKSLKIQPNFIILDIGGGQATTADIFSKHFPKNEIYIFEPINTNLEVIEKKSKNHPNWKIVPMAVGDTPGKSVININQRITASSLLESDNSDHLYNDALKTVNKQDINLTTLDTYFTDSPLVGIIKLDIQGFELLALKGGTQVLKNTEVIVLEITNHTSYINAPKYFEIDAFLREHNFEIVNILPSSIENHKLQEWDAIYKRVK